MIKEHEAFEYEVGKQSLLQAILFRIFTGYFIRKYTKRYDRYIEYHLYNEFINNQNK